MIAHVGGMPLEDLRVGGTVRVVMRDPAKDVDSLGRTLGGA